MKDLLLIGHRGSQMGKKGLKNIRDSTSLAPAGRGVGGEDFHRVSRAQQEYDAIL
jgi:hypothetical protein